MWDIQENLLEVSTKAQALALPAPDTAKAKGDKATQVALNHPTKVSYVEKETQISMEDNLEQRQICRTTHTTLTDNPLEKQLDY